MRIISVVEAAEGVGCLLQWYQPTAADLNARESTLSDESPDGSGAQARQGRELLYRREDLARRVVCLHAPEDA